MKKVLIVLGVILLLVGCGKKEATNEAKNGDTLNKEKEYVMGLDDTFAPMGFRDEKGELVGFDIDLAKEATEMMGIKIKFQPIDWSMKETELNAGNIDMIWNGYSITDARKEMVNFTTAYLKNKQIIVTLVDSPINSKADFDGKTVSVQGESSALDAVLKENDFVAKLKGGAPVEFPTNVECFKDLEASRSDGIVVDEVLARYYMKQNGEEKYKVLEDNFGEEEYGVGVRKDDTALLDGLNKAFEEMRNNGKYEEYYGKWFAEN